MHRLLQFVLEQLASIDPEDRETACKLVDAVLRIAEFVASRTKTRKDDEIVAQLRSLHTWICGAPKPE